MRTITYPQIAQAVREQCRGGTYPMSLTGQAAQCVHEAINQGIDAHLEACFCPSRGDDFHWDTRRAGKLVICSCLICQVSASSLPVLLRRLSEDEDEEAQSLVVDVLSTLEIHVEAGCYEIVSPVDEPTETQPA